MRPALAIASLAVLLGGCDAVERPLANATGFVAHMSCSCVFNSGRGLDSCLGDLPSEASWLDVEVDPGAHTVTANALWVDTVAQYSEGRGCKLRE